MTSNSIDITCSSVGAINQGNGTLNIGNMYVHTGAAAEIEDDFVLPPLIKLFTGRDKEMDQLHSLFFNKDKQKIKNKVVICGIGGIGKSELAKQFAKKCQDDGKIQDIYWINSEFESELKRSAKKIKEIYEEMNGKKCLFILDNGISRKKLAECEFQLPDEFLFIVTSQEQDWGRDIKSIKMDPLKLESALHFYKTTLKDDYKDKDRDLYIKLAELVGCIPLGLQITAAHVHQAERIYGENYIQAYVKKLKESQKEIIDKDFPSSANNCYNKSIYKAIAVSLKKLSDNKDIKCPGLALCSIYVCSYLNPEGIDFYDLLKVLKSVEEILGSESLDKDKLKGALFLLNNLSLVSYNPNGTVIKMHRFIQEVLRYHLRNHDTVMQKYCYAACLTCFLSDSYVYYSVLQYADENITVFKYFYNTLNGKFQKYSTNYNSAFVKICKALVRYECINSLVIIFQDLGSRAKEYINKCNLFNDAVRYCNETNILKLFLKYVNVNNQKYNGILNTLLHSAASSCNLKAFEFLLDNGADINTRNSKQMTPLHVFLNKRQWFGNIIQFLIIRGALLNIKDCNGMTPIALAQQNKTESDLIDLFFEDRFTEQLKKVFNELGDLNVINIINKFKLLHRAIEDKQTDLLDLLLEHNIDIDIRNKRQETPLHRAMWHWNFKAIKILMKHGADVSSKCFFGYTPLHDFFYGARIRKRIDLDGVNEILELVQCECNDNINAMTKYKNTLLHIVASSCHADLIDILVGKYKLNVNAQNFKGDTALHFLIYGQSKRLHSRKECDVIETALTLQAYGARLDIKNNKRLKPFQLATQEKLAFLLPYLIEERRKHRKCKCIIL